MRSWAAGISCCWQPARRPASRPRWWTAGSTARCRAGRQSPAWRTELPHLVEFADLARDPRGGRGRRELTADDYAAITAALRAGATADDLRGEFGIGWERARRMQAGFEEER